MAATSVDKLIESFENPAIPLIDGKPMYATIHAMHKLVNSNAKSVNTNPGCDMLEHLFLTLPPTLS